MYAMAIQDKEKTSWLESAKLETVTKHIFLNSIKHLIKLRLVPIFNALASSSLDLLALANKCIKK
jgi:hypothetical protein